MNCSDKQGLLSDGCYDDSNAVYRYVYRIKISCTNYTQLYCFCKEITKSSIKLGKIHVASLFEIHCSYMEKFCRVNFGKTITDKPIGKENLANLPAVDPKILHEYFSRSAKIII